MPHCHLTARGKLIKSLLPFPRQIRTILACSPYAANPFIIFWLIRRARIQGNFKCVHCIGPSMMVDRCSYPGRGAGPLIKSCHCTVMRGDFPRGFRRVRETGKRLATLLYSVPHVHSRAARDKRHSKSSFNIPKPLPLSPSVVLDISLKRMPKEVY